MGDYRLLRLASFDADCRADAFTGIRAAAGEEAYDGDFSSLDVVRRPREQVACRRLMAERWLAHAGADVSISIEYYGRIRHAFI